MRKSKRRRSSTASYVPSVHLSYGGYRQQHRRKEASFRSAVAPPLKRAAKQIVALSCCFSANKVIHERT